MSQKHPILVLTILAAAALTKNRFVTAGGAVATAAGTAIGVAAEDSDSGSYLPVDVLGTTTVEASAAIAVGAAIEVAANGKAVTKTAGVTVARALSAAAADGDLIEVVLIPN